MSDKRLISHSFPSRDQQRRQWIQEFGITTTLSTRSHVCSSHSLEEDYLPTKNGSKKLLKRNAIPSIILVEHQQDQIVNDADDADEPSVCEQPLPSKFVPSILKRRKKQHPSELLPAEQENNAWRMDEFDQAAQKAGSVGSANVPANVLANHSDNVAVLPEGYVQNENIESNNADTSPIHDSSNDHDDECDHFDDPDLAENIDGEDDIVDSPPDPSFGFDGAIEELE
ncbi:hypothetical protein QAD02_000040 [Eretmocerus hayati]|uniref:Uncharacterized protein n=1 Tax=Eretmocerus hayati TaxID=131215 RepID=A0ACC2NCG3_9HYME|nr:hypothetical protein QAD02_000040 [Eretmocerus hayati]